MLGLLVMLIVLVSAIYVAVPLPAAVAVVTARIAVAIAPSPFTQADAVPIVTSAGDTARSGRLENEVEAGGRNHAESVACADFAGLRAARIRHGAGRRFPNRDAQPW